MQRGIEVTDEGLAVEVIQQVGPGGNYLLHPSSFTGCRILWTPTVSDWESFDAWQDAGSQDPIISANRKYKEILANAPETFLEPALEKDLQRQGQLLHELPQGLPGRDVRSLN